MLSRCPSVMTSASMRPVRSASSVCSASDGEIGAEPRLTMRAGRLLAVLRSFTPYPEARLRSMRLHVEADEHALGVRQVADDLADRRRQAPHQRGDREYLVAASERRILQQ